MELFDIELAQGGDVELMITGTSEVDDGQKRSSSLSFGEELKDRSKSAKSTPSRLYMMEGLKTTESFSEMLEDC
ncbi:predicted protein [Sclerotinia sclerotiorum 1980 UF-70]|uniref:Uncharacterized protein n=2 Tax=Sclerotinia sclerotiorum (strain ATCC 18683 / 1980 / Ss-1) TaxID=665079 RepID=A7F7H1_SCLS1|nr:predicted protein [Sclerotinia sclerotiorum 1980 UF-70]APA15584.1 hypothetical protein sscle_15g103540 [Sclerotinia sclerotiorum 1980 UF-70]EDN98692.1 predicted protein [Sclerotinia sclerotiorum 1980 UF-70]